VISTRKFQGKVRLRNNEWAVVAGMVSEVESKAITGLAGLSTLPIIGPALRRNTTSREESNVLVVLKPRLTSLPPSESAPRTLWIGTETRPLSVL
jgi:Flp pilus assembly secretin CpaC